MVVGILALQGDYAAHGRLLDRLGVPHQEIRTPKALNLVDALIIPGGESSTLLKFFETEPFIPAIQAFAKTGKPIFGTCAGAILLATRVTQPAQQSLALVDVDIERNGYGRQQQSMIREGDSVLTDHPLNMVFIRAPRIKRCGEGVKILATYNGEPVCVQQNNCLLATFHPELTNDSTLHEYFLHLNCHSPPPSHL